MDILKRIEMLSETTTTGDVEQNKAKGHVDLLGMRYRKKKKKSKLTGKAYTVHEGKDFYDTIDIIGEMYSWSYVESEAKDVFRFDWGNKSMWVYKNGSVEGQIPPKIKNKLKGIIKK